MLREHRGLAWSLLGNVLLLGVLLWAWLGREAAVAHFGSVAISGAAAPGPGADWNAVRSADYAAYARNLRALGCPEATVIDIIVGEVTATYAARVRAEAGEPPWQYWQSVATASAEAATRREKRAALERERRTVLEQALGPQALQAMDKYRLWNDVDPDQAMLAFLPAAKRRELQAINTKYQQAGNAQDAATDEELRRAASAKAQQRAEIAALLSVQELEDLDLRQSETSDRLRQELRGFQASEAEFRELFKARRAYETTLASNTDVRDPNVLQVRIEAERRFAEEARAALGQQRYADYQRARDPDFQNALQLTQFYSLPEDIAGRVYQLKQDVDGRASAITANAALSEQRQRELLAQLQSETERSLQSLLGSEVLKEYRRNNRWWLWGD